MTWAGIFTLLAVLCAVGWVVTLAYEHRMLMREQRERAIALARLHHPSNG